MNSIRTQDKLQRAWLSFNKVSVKDGHATLRSQMFDGTLFEITIPTHEYEDQGEIALVEVGYIGDIAGVSEVILPRPTLSHGHNVRVAPNFLLKWHEYNLLKEKKKL